MSGFRAYQLCFHNAAHQFGVRTVYDKKNSLLHELVFQISCRFFQRKKTFLSGNIGKVDNLLYHFFNIGRRSFKDKSKTLKSGYVIRQGFGCQNGKKRPTECNNRRWEISITSYISNSRRIDATITQHTETKH